MKLIGLTGRAGVGKDTVGAILSRNHGFTLTSFAGPIKGALNAMHGWNSGHWEDRAWKERVLPELGVSPRRLAQTFGTEWARDLIHKDYWLLLAKERWSNYQLTAKHTGGQYPGLVITDVRFDNEADWIRSAGGTIVRIERDDVPPVAAHQSESGVTPHCNSDAILPNNGSISALTNRVAWLIRHLN